MKIFHTLKKHIRKLIIGHHISTYYFSSRGEDAILYAIFQKKLEKKEKGFFIDIGAYHPYLHSNTYFFYINGWNGINIDACPGSMESFKKHRKRDINLEVGVGQEESILTYYFIDENSTMNSFSKENLEKTHMMQHVKKQIPIPVLPLREILKQYEGNFDQIDFINIDVEGLDFEVIKSNDWDKYRPKVIVIELDVHSIEDIKENKTAKFLLDIGYEVVAKNVILYHLASVIFVDKNFKY